MVLLCLPDGGTGFESGVHRLAVCRGEHDGSVYPSEVEGKIMSVFMFFWTEVLRKAVDSQKGCEQQTVKQLSLGVAKCAIVRMCFPTHLSSPGEWGGCL